MDVDHQSTSLDTEETTQHSPTSASYHDYLVTLNPDRYHTAAESYAFLDGRDGTNKADRITSCRSRAWFARNLSTHKVRVLANACRLRWCPLCADATKRLIAKNTLEWLRHQAHAKMLTLTLRHSNAPLAHQVSSLYRFFARFRRQRLLRHNVNGGIWFFQITFSESDQQWHPHLHVAMNSNYISQKDLSELWNRVTGGSYIVDIRQIRNPKKSAEYVARYCSGPCDLTSLDFPQRIELIDALHGRRVCGTFGSAKDLTLRTEKPADRSQWRNVGSFWAVFHMRHTDTNAALIWKAWRFNGPLPDDITIADIDNWLDGIPDLTPPLYEEPPPQLF